MGRIGSGRFNTALCRLRPSALCGRLTGRIRGQLQKVIELSKLSESSALAVAAASRRRMRDYGKSDHRTAQPWYKILPEIEHAVGTPPVKQ